MKEKEENRDSLMRSSYYIVTRNFTKTVNKFIVYKDSDRSIEIQHGIGHRSKFVDMMIDYFERMEEFREQAKSMIFI